MEWFSDRGSTPLASTKREPGEHRTDNLHDWRRVCLGLSAVRGKIKKEVTEQEISCTVTSFSYTNALTKIVIF